MSKINAPLIVLFLLSSLMLTCSNQEYAIFYFVENEKEQVDNSLDNNLSILSMVKSGSEYFIAAAGSMYTRSEGDDVKEWDHVDFPSGADYCTAMAFFDDGGGGKIYAAFLMDNGSFALFRGNPAKSPGWTEIMDAKVRDRQIIRLEVVTGGAADQLFAIVFDDDKYNLYYSDDGSVFNDALLGQDEIIRNVVYDSVGVQFWTITKTKVFTFSGVKVIGSFSEKPSNLPDTNGGYMGVLWNNGFFYVSTFDGVVSSSPDGDTWTDSDTESVSGRNVPFTFFGVADGNVLVGTIGYGFFEMQDGTVGNLSRMSEFTANELYNGWVTGFYFDSPRVFCLTAGSGLWRNLYSTGDWDDWVWE